MLVKDWMNKSVFSVSANDSVQQAIKLQKKNTVGILLVYDDGRLAGIVADMDLKKAIVPDLVPIGKTEAFNMLSNIKVRQIMSPRPLTVTPEHTMDEAAELLLKNKISAAPVVNNDDKVVGVVNRSDILEFLMSVTGVDKIGYQLHFNVLDMSGYIYEAIKIIKDYGGRVWNIACSYHGAKAGFRNVSIRVYNIKSDKMPDLLKRVKEKTHNLYYVDYINNKRGEFKT